MFYHVKELQFNARVSGPDPQFATLLLDQFGGPNGELKAAIQYFIQAFTVKFPYPDKYDMLMDIATEEFSHLEIVGATIQMLLSGIDSEMKNVADQSDLMKMMTGSSAKENMLHAISINPQFFNESGGGPTLTDANGNPWSGKYINANGDLTVDLRSNIAAEARAKIVYEYLLKFTDDPSVKETLMFLMTREIAHFQMFEAALNSIEPNFPPGSRQGDPRFSNKYYNMSDGIVFRGPWNEGKSPELGEQWEYIENPQKRVEETDGMLQETVSGTEMTEKNANLMSLKVSSKRVEDITKNTPKGQKVWTEYPSSKKK